jgi:hypothetical protein
VAGCIITQTKTGKKHMSDNNIMLIHHQQVLLSYIRALRKQLDATQQLSDHNSDYLRNEIRLFLHKAKEDPSIEKSRNEGMEQLAKHITDLLL